MKEKDFVIVGSGIAGLSAAFFAAQKGSVTLITEGFDLRNSKSFENNDGILFSKNLDILHSDISKAAYGFENQEKVDFFIENINGVYFFLKDVMGIKFSSKGERIFGYSEENVFFAGERTGEEICKKFISKIENNPNIEIVLNTKVDELIFEKIEEREARKEFVGGNKVFGVVGKHLETGVYKNFLGRNILLATGSGEGIYDFNYMSDGIKLAKSVGAKIGKMNHISWNPFCLDLPSAKRYFLPLQILNYGAFLINEKGEKFLQKYFDGEEKNLLLSDFSNIFFTELKKNKSGNGKIFLDMRHKSKIFWEEKFPDLIAFLNVQGVHVSQDVLPLKNIQQFLIGGVEVSESAKTSVQGLYASGELANFGVLGQNWLPGVLISKSIILSKSFVDNAVL